jgi:DNA repair protein RecN (Recombination protein N)
VLEELRIRGLGVIAEAVVELRPGFTAITGETGAGKTLLLTGLNLLLGGRADAGAVRSGCERAEIEGRARVATDSAATARAADAGADLDDGSLLLARTVSAEGRSRAYAGGRSVPVSVLSDVADDLVAVHGQADQRGLLRPATQRTVLDRYGGADLAAASDAYRALFAEVRAVSAELTEVTGRRRERAQEADLLRFGLQQIDAVAPQPGEDVALRAEVERLLHVDELRRAADTAHDLVAGGDDGAADVLTLLGGARQAVELMRGRDAALDALAARLAEAAYLLVDVGADIAAYREGLDADPARLEQAQERLAQLTALVRKYAPDVDAVRDWADTARARLEALDGDDERVDELAARHDGLLADLATSAEHLSALRRSAADQLEASVTSELAALAMPHARLHVAVSQREADSGLSCFGRTVAFGPAGIDDVELLLVAHAGAAPTPLHRGASGGELSRVMLALEVVLAGSDPVPTFVFDEVDAGVGGRAAVEIGRRLARLARAAQVIVVTHLPQVAAFADDHLVVSRSDDGSVTTTGVRRVDGADRLEELSRMLAGLPDSQLARGHAEELLAVASDAKRAG